jgi:hypothetical protein
VVQQLLAQLPWDLGARPRALLLVLSPLVGALEYAGAASGLIWERR